MALGMVFDLAPDIPGPSVFRGRMEELARLRHGRRGCDRAVSPRPLEIDLMADSWRPTRNPDVRSVYEALKVLGITPTMMHEYRGELPQMNTRRSHERGGQWCRRILHPRHQGASTHLTQFERVRIKRFGELLSRDDRGPHYCSRSPNLRRVAPRWLLEPMDSDGSGSHPDAIHDVRVPGAETRRLSSPLGVC